MSQSIIDILLRVSADTRKAAGALKELSNQQTANAQSTKESAKATQELTNSQENAAKAAKAFTGDVKAITGFFDKYNASVGNGSSALKHAVGETNKMGGALSKTQAVLTSMNPQWATWSQNVRSGALYQSYMAGKVKASADGLQFLNEKAYASLGLTKEQTRALQSYGKVQGDFSKTLQRSGVGAERFANYVRFMGNSLGSTSDKMSAFLPRINAAFNGVQNFSHHAKAAGMNINEWAKKVDFAKIQTALFNRSLVQTTNGFRVYTESGLKALGITEQQARSMGMLSRGFNEYTAGLNRVSKLNEASIRVYDRLIGKYGTAAGSISTMGRALEQTDRYITSNVNSLRNQQSAVARNSTEWRNYETRIQALSSENQRFALANRLVAGSHQIVGNELRRVGGATNEFTKYVRNLRAAYADNIPAQRAFSQAALQTANVLGRTSAAIKNWGPEFNKIGAAMQNMAQRAGLTNQQFGQLVRTSGIMEKATAGLGSKFKIANGVLHEFNQQLGRYQPMVMRINQATGQAVLAQDKLAQGIKATNQEATRARGGLANLGQAVTTGAASARMAVPYMERLGVAIRSLAAWIPAAMIIGSFFQLFVTGKQAVIEFDQSLKNLQAITNATPGQLQLIADAVKNVASTTKFSATEIGDAMVFIGQAGFSAAESVNTINATANLATGTLSTLTEASKLMTTALRVFKLESAEAARVSDVFANAVNKSKVTVEGLNTVFNYLGPVAQASGLSIEETTGAIMGMANAGIRFSTIGTSLRQVLSRLQSPTARMATLMDEAGVSMADLDTRSNSLATVADNLAKVIGGDTAKAFQAFGLRGANAAIVISTLGSDLQFLVDQASHVGTAAQMAGIQMEGLGVASKNLLDKVQLLGIELFQGVAIGFKLILDVIRPVIDLFTVLAQTAGGQFLITFTAIAGAIKLVHAAFSSLITLALAKWIGTSTAAVTALVAHVAKVQGSAKIFVAFGLAAEALRASMHRLIAIPMAAWVGSNVSAMLNYIRQVGLATAAANMFSAALASGTSIVTIFTRSIKALALALITTPVGWLIAGLAALSAAFITSNKRMQDSIATTEKLGLKYAQTAKNFDKFASDLEGATEGSVEQTRVLDRLSETHVALAERLKNSNLSIDEQREALKGAAEEQRRMALQQFDAHVDNVGKAFEKNQKKIAAYQHFLQAATGEASLFSRALSTFRHPLMDLVYDFLRIKDAIMGTSSNIDYWAKKVTEGDEANRAFARSLGITMYEQEKLGGSTEKTTKFIEAMARSNQSLADTAEGTVRFLHKYDELVVKVGENLAELKNEAAAAFAALSGDPDSGLMGAWLDMYANASAAQRAFFIEHGHKLSKALDEFNEYADASGMSMQERNARIFAMEQEHHRKMMQEFMDSYVNPITSEIEAFYQRRQDLANEAYQSELDDLKTKYETEAALVEMYAVDEKQSMALKAKLLQEYNAEYIRLTAERINDAIARENESLEARRQIVREMVRDEDTKNRTIIQMEIEANKRKIASWQEYKSAVTSELGSMRSALLAHQSQMESDARAHVDALNGIWNQLFDDLTRINHTIRDLQREKMDGRQKTADIYAELAELETAIEKAAAEEQWDIVKMHVSRMEQLYRQVEITKTRRNKDGNVEIIKDDKATHDAQISLWERHKLMMVAIAEEQAKSLGRAYEAQREAALQLERVLTESITALSGHLQDVVKELNRINNYQIKLDDTIAIDQINRLMEVVSRPFDILIRVFGEDHKTLFTYFNEALGLVESFADYFDREANRDAEVTVNTDNVDEGEERINELGENIDRVSQSDPITPEVNTEQIDGAIERVGYFGGLLDRFRNYFNIGVNVDDQDVSEAQGAVQDLAAEAENLRSTTTDPYTYTVRTGSIEEGTGRILTLTTAWQSMAEREAWEAQVNAQQVEAAQERVEELGQAQDNLANQESAELSVETSSLDDAQQDVDDFIKNLKDFKDEGQTVLDIDSSAIVAGTDEINTLVEARNNANDNTEIVIKASAEQVEQTKNVIVDFQDLVNAVREAENITLQVNVDSVETARISINEFKGFLENLDNAKEITFQVVTESIDQAILKINEFVAFLDRSRLERNILINFDSEQIDLVTSKIEDLERLKNTLNQSEPITMEVTSESVAEAIKKLNDFDELHQQVQEIRDIIVTVLTEQIDQAEQRITALESTINGIRDAQEIVIRVADDAIDAAKEKLSTLEAEVELLRLAEAIIIDAETDNIDAATEKVSEFESYLDGISDTKNLVVEVSVDQIESAYEKIKEFETTLNEIHTQPIVITVIYDSVEQAKESIISLLNLAASVNTTRPIIVETNDVQVDRSSEKVDLLQEKIFGVDGIEPIEPIIDSGRIENATDKVNEFGNTFDKVRQSSSSMSVGVDTSDVDSATDAVNGLEKTRLEVTKNPKPVPIEVDTSSIGDAKNTLNDLDSVVDQLRNDVDFAVSVDDDDVHSALLTLNVFDEATGEIEETILHVGTDTQEVDTAQEKVGLFTTFVNDAQEAGEIIVSVVVESLDLAIEKINEFLAVKREANESEAIVVQTETSSLETAKQEIQVFQEFINGISEQSQITVSVILEAFEEARSAIIAFKDDLVGIHDQSKIIIDVDTEQIPLALEQIRSFDEVWSRIKETSELIIQVVYEQVTEAITVLTELSTKWTELLNNESADLDVTYEDVEQSTERVTSLNEEWSKLEDSKAVNLQINSDAVAQATEDSNVLKDILDDLKAIGQIVIETINNVTGLEDLKDAKRYHDNLDGRQTSSYHTIYVRTVETSNAGGLVGSAIQKLNLGGIAKSVRDSVAQKLNFGGSAKRLFGDGRVPGEHGAGGMGRDSVDALLTPGEFVLNRKAVRHWGIDLLHAMNDMEIPKEKLGFNKGGPVQASNTAKTHETPYSATINLTFGNDKVYPMKMDTRMARDLVKELRKMGASIA